MADIRALADRAVQIFRSSKATSWKSAARQAVRRKGITYKPDVERIASEICRELQKRSVAKRRANRRRGIRESDYRRPQQLSFRF